MNFLTIYAALVILTPNDATSHYSSKLGADRNQNKENIDMDSLMDTHCSQCQRNELTKESCAGLSPMKSKPQHKPKVLSKYFESVLLPESGTGERIFGNLKDPQDASTTENNAETEITSSEANTIPPVLRKLFLDHRSKVSKRGSIYNSSVLHRWRKAEKTREKPSSSWADQSISPSFANNVLAPKSIPPVLQSLKGPEVTLLPPCKRFADTNNASKVQPNVVEKQGIDERRVRDVHDQEKWNWEEWRSIKKSNAIRKREAGRRLKISDIWNKPKKDHEEPVKIVLPLLLSDMKDSREVKKPIMLFLPKGAGKIAVHNSMSDGTTTSAENLQTRNFKVKGEDGKEFSFSASIFDVQQLLGLLAKPDSTLMLEKVSPDKGKAEKKLTPTSTKKYTALATPKLVEKDWLAGCSENSDTPELKEIETDCLENVVQVDFPCNKSTAASRFSDIERFSSTTEDLFGSK